MNPSIFGNLWLIPFPISITKIPCERAIRYLKRSISHPWLEAQKEYRFYSSNDTLGFSLDSVLELIDTEKEFWKLCAAKTWCFAHPSEVFPHLICRLSNKTKIGIVNTADLIIWDRIRSGELKFYGHGGGMQEDIFTVAGRASWILNWMTGENFASVGIELTPAFSHEYQAAWVRYIQTNSK